MEKVEAIHKCPSVEEASQPETPSGDSNDAVKVLSQQEGKKPSHPQAFQGGIQPKAMGMLVLQDYTSLDFSQWKLVASGKNKYNGLNWNLNASQKNGNVFNFHQFPRLNGGCVQGGDPWSTIAWELKGNNFEGGAANKAKVTFDVSDPQEQMVENFDDMLISRIEEQAMEVLSQKSPVKRATIVNHHYKSALVPKAETHGPRVKMSFVIRNADPRMLGTMYYYKLSEDGESYETKPVIARGWDEIEPLITGHFLRGAKMRATMVKFWSISCTKKEIYPTMEIREMHVREPKQRRLQYATMTSEQEDIMLAMD